MQKVGIIGAGAFGTALGQSAALAGRDVVIWNRDTAVIDAINEQRCNPAHLPDIRLHPAIFADDDLERVIATADLVLLVTPAQTTRAFLSHIKTVSSSAPIVLCAKGIEVNSGLLLPEMADGILQDVPYCVLSGPGFAADLAAGRPTALSLGSSDMHLARQVAACLATDFFRPYANSDPLGVAVGGALKNVIAIACGIADGLDFGVNSRAALMARSLVELARFTHAKGGRTETLMGLSGVGDLALTCASAKSRNYRFGLEMASTSPLAAQGRSTTEGVPTAGAVVGYARRKGLDMPICQAVHAVVNEGADIQKEISHLLNRPLVDEEFFYD